jgi:transcriptional regulator with XRE-family HTH domain
MIETVDAGFGRRLRMERERRRITLASIAENTKIGLSLLQGLERDDISRWPSGIFRRSFIRAYAQAIGLDADATAREFFERYPEPSEVPPPVPATRAPSVNPVKGASIDTHVARFRLRVADTRAAFAPGPLLTEARRRWVAVAWDVSAVVAIGVLLFVAIDKFWMPFAMVLLGYYAGSIVLLGNTPGVSLFAPDSRRETQSPGSPKAFSSPS